MHYSGKQRHGPSLTDRSVQEMTPEADNHPKTTTLTGYVTAGSVLSVHLPVACTACRIGAVHSHADDGPCDSRRRAKDLRCIDRRRAWYLPGALWPAVGVGDQDAAGWAKNTTMW